MNPNDNTAPAGLARLGRVGALLAVIGLIGIVIGALMVQGDPVRLKYLLQSYLFGWVLAMMLALGCFGWMLVHYMSRGVWGMPTVRLFEAGAKTLPLMLLLFVPILIWHKGLYPWANPDLVYGNPALGIKPDETLMHRAGYMNITMFTFRTFVYFGIWSFFTFIQTRLSIRLDETGDERIAVFRQRMSAFGFVLFVVTLTLAFTDWIMSLDSHWFSTIYGFWFLDFVALAAMAFVTLIVCRYQMAHREPYDTMVTTQVIRDLGNLLLTAVMVWAYFSVSQWIIIWSGNLPDEVTFYLRRNSGTFLLVGAANIIFSFFVPFVLLLSGNTKRRPQLLASVCVLLLVMRVVDGFWIVILATRHPIMPLATDIAGSLLMVGAFVAGFSYWVAKAPLVPLRDDPMVREVVAHG
jgi:hypothetical protein